MQKDQIASTLEDILLQSFRISKEDLQPEKNIENDLGIDSLQRVSLTIECEEKFNVSISDSEILGVRTYGDLVGLLEKSIAESNS